MRAMRMWSRVGLLALVASAASGQNLTPDPDFDADLGAWAPSSAGWSYLAGGWPTGVVTPGSARGVNTAAAATQDIELVSACFPVEPATRYLVSFQGFVPTGQASTGHVRLKVAGFANADCTGSSFTHGYLGVATPDTSWSHWWTWHDMEANLHSGRVTIGVRKNEAGGSFEARADALYVGRPVKGDFNHDGRADLVFDHLTDDDYLFWFMARERQASAAALAPGGPTSNWKLGASDDFDGDGQTDLVFRESATGTTAFWLMNEVTAPAVHPLLSNPPAPEWSLTAAADFNHDRHPDLLWRNGQTQKLEVWTLNGTAKLGTIVPNPDHAVDGNWACVAALDVDRDGNPDLLWYNATTGKIVVWYMDANVVRITGNFTVPSSAGNNNWKVLAAGDYATQPNPADDSVDIVWRNETSGKLVMWSLDRFGVRVTGVFTTPANPQPALDWTVAGPR